MKRTITLLSFAFVLLTGAMNPLFAKGQSAQQASSTILVAAAASLKNAFDGQLIPAFKQKYPWITVEGTYDSSGKLQTQIENGLEADVFMSAATRQMTALTDSGLVAKDSVKPLLENKIVLIKTAGIATPVSAFENATGAASIALGDPASVPAGQYAQEAFTTLGIWDELAAKASFGTNVTEVLNWVGAGSAEVGVVYATDAASTDKVEIIAALPDGILSTPVIYPLGMVAASGHTEEARLFIDFLASEEGLAIFKTYGFSANK
ncbi:MAG: molybdate ABC transporter substrate-binding protein [Treponema sp.]|jgi:molybdate transport system substrate-binding protein|nr:molybdate ABC transporter substrate-binding protein [Treponema sp.]